MLCGLCSINRQRQYSDHEQDKILSRSRTDRSVRPRLTFYSHLPSAKNPSRIMPSLLSPSSKHPPCQQSLSPTTAPSETPTIPACPNKHNSEAETSIETTSEPPGTLSQLPDTNGATTSAAKTSGASGANTTAATSTTSTKLHPRDTVCAPPHFGPLKACSINELRSWEAGRELAFDRWDQALAPMLAVLAQVAARGSKLNQTLLGFLSARVAADRAYATQLLAFEPGVDSAPGKKNATGLHFGEKTSSGTGTKATGRFVPVPDEVFSERKRPNGTGSTVGVNSRGRVAGRTGGLFRKNSGKEQITLTDTSGEEVDVCVSQNGTVDLDDIVPRSLEFQLGSSCSVAAASDDHCAGAHAAAPRNFGIMSSLWEVQRNVARSVFEFADTVEKLMRQNGIVAVTSANQNMPAAKNGKTKTDPQQIKQDHMPVSRHATRTVTDQGSLESWSKPGLLPQYRQLAQEGLSKLFQAVRGARKQHETTLNRWMAVQRGFRPGDLVKKPEATPAERSAVVGGQSCSEDAPPGSTATAGSKPERQRAARVDDLWDLERAYRSAVTDTARAQKLVVEVLEEVLRRTVFE